MECFEELGLQGGGGRASKARKREVSCQVELGVEIAR